MTTASKGNQCVRMYKQKDRFFRLTDCGEEWYTLTFDFPQFFLAFWHIFTFEFTETRHGQQLRQQ